MSSSPTILLAALAAALLAAPASAAAAPHWSAPDIVFGADPAAQAAPSIVMDAAGTAIAVSSDSRGPVIATGDAAGHFGAPVPVAAGEPPADAVTEALGTNGTLAVGWSSSGVVKVAVRAAGTGSAFAAPAELATANGDAPALAVGPDGTVTAAWRERSGTGKAKTYVIRTVSFGPSGGSGDAQSFDAGAAPVDGAIAAVAPDGTVAIAWRRAAPAYHVRVEIRPPGGQFGQPALLTSGGNGLDTDVNLAFAADGTLAAGWANQDGAFASLRPANGDFGPAQQISAAGQRGYGLGLAGGPGGALAAAWDGNGVVRFADGSAAGFGAPGDIAPVTASQVVTNVGLAFDAGGTLEAAWRDAGDSSIHTADRPAGAAFSAQAVGYGDTQTIGVDVAAGPAGRAAALWRVRDGSVAAVVRSETADTTPDADAVLATTRPGAKDTKAPRVTLVGRPSAKLGRKRTITLRIRCTEACTLSAAGRVLLARFSAPLTPPKPTTKARTGTQRLTLKLGTRTLRDTRAILKRRGHATARVEISARDAASNAGLARFSIMIRR